MAAPRGQKMRAAFWQPGRPAKCGTRGFPAPGYRGCGFSRCEHDPQWKVGTRHVNPVYSREHSLRLSLSSLPGPEWIQSPVHLVVLTPFRDALTSTFHPGGRQERLRSILIRTFRHRLIPAYLEAHAECSVELAQESDELALYSRSSMRRPSKDHDPIVLRLPRVSAQVSSYSSN